MAAKEIFFLRNSARYVANCFIFIMTINRAKTLQIWMTFGGCPRELKFVWYKELYFVAISYRITFKSTVTFEILCHYTLLLVKI